MALGTEWGYQTVALGVRMGYGFVRTELAIVAIAQAHNPNVNC
ncbi:hypothetical protein ACQ4M4_09980 [Leptolyngbya sp. AN02str]